MKKKSLAKSAAAMLMALTLVFTTAAGSLVPAMAQDENLKITVRNNEGLPPMKKGQFRLYQIFKGSANRDGEVSTEDPEYEEWNAQEWDNWTLADIQWGDSIPGGGVFVTLLQFLTKEADPWAFVDESGNVSPEGTNAFKDIDVSDPDKIPGNLAKVLEGKSNEFMQGFASWLVHDKHLKWPPMNSESGYKEEVSNDPSDPRKDTVTFTVPEPGYYLLVEVDDATREPNIVSEYLFTVLGNQEIDLKGTAPTVDKAIASTENKADGDAAGVSDVVTFELTGTLPKNFEDFENYVFYFHDTLSEGLTYSGDETVVVTVIDSEGNTYELDKDQIGFSVVKDGAEAGFKGPEYENSSKVTFKFDDIRKDLNYTKKNGSDESNTYSLKYGDKIVVTYNAKVNEKAAIGGVDDKREGNPNAVVLEFSNDPSTDGTGHTPESDVYVYSFGLDLKKVGDDDAHAEQLEGAGFILLRNHKDDEMGPEKLQIAKFTPGEGKMTLQAWEDFETSEFNQTLYPAYTKAADELAKASSADRQDEGSEKHQAVTNALNALSAYIATSGADGQLPNLEGLDEGTFILREVVTPAGYNTMDDVTVTIDAWMDIWSGKLTNVAYEATTGLKTNYFFLNDADTAVFNSGLLPDTLVNEKAPLLPFTGGMGAVIAIGLCAAALAAGGIMFISFSKKKDSAEEG